MFIVWQGFGFLIVAIPFVLSLLGKIVIDALCGTNYYNGHPAIFGLTLLISAIIAWVLGHRLNGAPGRQLVDPKTGQQFILKQKHTFFWIPMEWFSAVLAAYGMYLVVR